MSQKTIDQTIGKLSVTGELGELLDKELATYTGEVEQHRGGAAALKAAASAVLKLGEHAKKDFEEGQYAKLDDKAVLDLVMKYIRRAGAVCENLSERSKTLECVAGGKVAATRSSVATIQRFHNVCKSRYDQLTAPPEPIPEDDGVKRTRSGRVSVSERRKEAPAAKPTEVKAKRRPRKKPVKVEPTRVADDQ